MTAYLLEVPEDHPINKVIMKHCAEFIKWSSGQVVINVSMEDEFEAAKQVETPINLTPKKVKEVKPEFIPDGSVFDGIQVENEEIQRRVVQAKKYEQRLKVGKNRAARGLDLEEGVTRCDPLNKGDVIGKEKEIQC